MTGELEPVPIDALIKEVIGVSFSIYNVLGFGFLESVYHNALAIELTKPGIAFQCKLPIKVRYLDHIVGVFEPDVLIGDRLILELKSLACLAKAHEAQLVNYLVATGIEDGLLINFGPEKVEVKRKYRVFRRGGN